VHLADDPLRAVADGAASQIAAALNPGNGNGAEVVPLPGRGQKPAERAKTSAYCPKLTVPPQALELRFLAKKRHS
jgi:hypothetical protein